jgi:ribosome biogenesis GTPase
MIHEYGWSDALQAAFEPHVAAGLSPARVIAHHRGLWRLATDVGECAGRLSGRFAAEAAAGEHPVVGDWLAISREADDGDALIQALMPRKSAFARRAAGGVGVQIVAANVDIAFLVAGMNSDLNPRRLERYLIAARDSGAAPVVVLTKSDLSSDPESERQAIVDIAAGAPVVTLSALTGEGLDALKEWLRPGVTAALLGSSGAGKSTLLNALAGQDLMSTGAVREADDRGRHTTTHRELFRLSGGALLIDTPGMRELGLVAEEAALDESFIDIVELIPACKFSDCSHVSEPGCAILAAIADGDLSVKRWESYLKLQREMAFVVRKDDPAADAANRERWKGIHKTQRAKYKHRRDNERG